MVKIAVGSDHGGFELKQALADHLRNAGHEVTDLGTNSSDSVDYPDFGVKVGEAVANGTADAGVAVCGSGIGIAMAANKVSGVRAANIYDVTSARLSREHNNANVACFGERLVGAQTAQDALDVWLATDFEAGGRHERRVAQLNNL